MDGNEELPSEWRAVLDANPLVRSGFSVDRSLSYSNPNELHARIQPLAKHLRGADPVTTERSTAQRPLSRRLFIGASPAYAWRYGPEVMATIGDDCEITFYSRWRESKTECDATWTIGGEPRSGTVNYRLDVPIPLVHGPVTTPRRRRRSALTRRRRAAS